MDLWIGGKPLVFTGGYDYLRNTHGPDPEAERLTMAKTRHSGIQGSIASRESLLASLAVGRPFGSLSVALLILSRP